MSNKQDDSLDNPHMVKSHDIHIDAEYAEWIAELKHRYRSAQVKAAVKVNAEKLLFNWQLGCDLVQKKAEERWGAGVVEQVSLDLKREFPNENGFSTVEFPLPFALVPWGQHIEIMTRSKSLEEALFYVHQVVDKGLSRPALINCFKAHLYEHHGKIVNNFSDHLPDIQSRLVQEVLKENYDFSFATVEHDPYEERELEDALTKDVTDLLLEMGTGFAFVGRQKEIIVGGRSRKIDLLF